MACVVLMTGSQAIQAGRASHPTCYGCASKAEIAEGKRVVREVFGLGYAGRVAACIVGRESGWNPFAVSATGDHGLFQFNRLAHPWLDMSRIYEIRFNVRLAWRMSRHGTNWGPWSGGTYACS